MKKIFYAFFIYSGLCSFIRYLNRNKITIISYHAPRYDIFSKHLNYLSKKYNFCSINDFYESILDNRHISRGLIVTFDDGHRSNVELLPLIKEYQLIPVIYLCSRVVGTNHPFWWKTIKNGSAKYYKECTNQERLSILQQKGFYTTDMVVHEPHGLTKEDLLKLKDYVIFGSHTRIHPILPQCTHREQWNEIVNSKKELEELCKCNIEHFAYPNGDYDNYSLECVQMAGYKTARTTDAGWNNKSTNLFKLKVIGISDDADIMKLRFQLSGLSLWFQYLLKGSLTGKK